MGTTGSAALSVNIADREELNIDLREASEYPSLDKLDFVTSSS